MPSTDHLTRAIRRSGWRLIVPRAVDRCDSDRHSISGSVDHRTGQLAAGRRRPGATDSAFLPFTDGRPHTSPVGRDMDGQPRWASVCVLRAERAEAQNLATPQLWRSQGHNTWNDGLDVVVEGDAERVTSRDRLTILADAIREKYHGDWDFTPADDGFGHTDDAGDSHIAYVYRVPPAKVLAFAKSPHGQTTFRF